MGGNVRSWRSVLGVTWELRLKQTLSVRRTGELSLLLLQDLETSTVDRADGRLPYLVGKIEGLGHCKS